MMKGHATVARRGRPGVRPSFLDACAQGAVPYSQQMLAVKAIASPWCCRSARQVVRWRGRPNFSEACRGCASQQAQR